MSQAHANAAPRRFGNDLERALQFVGAFGDQFLQPLLVRPQRALRLLQRYPWPGNVRELQNIIERAGVLESEPGVIRASTLEPWLKIGQTNAPVVDGLAGKPLADIEKQVILTTLQQFRGHRIKTATALGIGVRTLGMKL